MSWKKQKAWSCLYSTTLLWYQIKMSSVWKEEKQLRLKTYIEETQEKVKLPPNGDTVTLKQAEQPAHKDTNAASTCVSWIQTDNHHLQQHLIYAASYSSGYWWSKSLCFKWQNISSSGMWLFSRTDRFDSQFHATDKRLHNKEYNKAKVQFGIFWGLITSS